MDIWIIFIIIYTILVSFFETSRKKAAEKSSIFSVLYLVTLIALILSVFISPDFYQAPLSAVISIGAKSIIVVFAWFFGLYALSKLPISTYSIVHSSRIVFAVILSVIIFSEPLSTEKIIGIILIIAGIVLANYNPKEKKKKKKAYSYLPIILLLVACVLTAVSEILDKALMRELSVGQMQTWFLFFSAIYFRIILLIKREKVNYKLITTNYWIPLSSVFLVSADRFLFYANKDPGSEVSIMVLFKQLSVILLIIMGKIFFKEKNIVKKLLCSLLIIAGVAVLFI
ncbi:EamA family transporter [Candidatus Saccharibacteria bacterium]|nr:EamA family transporter [Candidatus Saccharibacteria bacterium]